MKKMLIIMTVPLNRNGISSVVMQFLDYINLSKYKVSILCNNYIDDEYKKVIKNKGINFFTFERKKKPLSYFLYLKKLNDDNNYDIVHIHGNSATMILETLALKNKNNKVIVHSHSTRSDHMLINKFIKQIFNYTYDLALSCSKEAGEWLFTRKFIVIPNCINVDKFKFSNKIRIKKRKELGINNQVVIGHVGLINEPKNHKRLLQIFKEYNDLNENSILLCVTGTVDLPNYIDKMINDLCLNDKVIILKNRSDVHELLQVMDVFVFPSVYEGFGISVIEAQASGLPCICSTAVPLSTDICKYNSYISLNDSNQKWVNEIISKLLLDIDRVDGYKIVKKSIYDSSNIKNVINDIYE